jgi:hypothetical protein
MKKLVVLLTFLFLPCLLHGQIVFKFSVTCDQTNNATPTCTNPNPVQIAAGDTILLWIYVGGAVNYTVTDNCTGGSQTWQNLVNFSATNQRQLRAVTSAIAGQCQFTADRGAGTGNMQFSWIAAVYSGVGSLAAPQGVITGVTNLVCTMQYTTDHPNSVTSWVFNWNNGVNGAFTFALTGDGVERSRVIKPASSLIVGDANTTTPGTFNTTYTVTTTGATPSCGRSAIEMIPSTPAGRAAVLGDQMQTVLFSAPGATYTLPSTILNNNPLQGWCTWLMATDLGAGSHITPDPSTTLNGGTNSINNYPWQMNRICQDSSGAYWTNPPLRAGPNVTISPSPTEIVISATGGGGGTQGPATQLQFGTNAALNLASTQPTSGQCLTYNGSAIIGGSCNPPGGAFTKIAGGTFTMPATAVNANTCLTIVNMTNVNFPGIGVNNVQQTDVVSFTTQTTPGGWDNGRLQLRAEPFAGSISWRECNSSTTTNFTGEAIPINWFVLR